MNTFKLPEAGHTQALKLVCEMMFLSGMVRARSIDEEAIA